MSTVEIKTQSEIDEYSQDEKKLVCLLFHAIWCSPCKMLEKNIHTLEEDNGVIFIEADIDECDESIIEKYHVVNIPHMVYLKGGDVVDTTIGLLSVDQLKEKIKENKTK